MEGPLWPTWPGEPRSQMVGELGRGKQSGWQLSFTPVQVEGGQCGCVAFEMSVRAGEVLGEEGKSLEGCLGTHVLGNLHTQRGLDGSREGLEREDRGVELSPGAQRRRLVGPLSDLGL